ncbi:ABC transporter ATP-binding protein [Pseudomonadota bacterium]
MKEFAQKFFVILGGDLRGFIFLFALFIASAMLEMLGLAMFAPFIASIAAPDILTSQPRVKEIADAIGISEHKDLVLVMGAAMIALFMIRSASTYWIEQKRLRYAFSKQTQLRVRLMNAYLNLPYAQHLQTNSASLINSIIGHTGAFIGSVLGPVLAIGAAALRILAIVIVLAITNFNAMVIVMLVMGGTIYGVDRVLKRRLRELGERASLANTGLIKAVRQGIGGLKEVRVLGCEQEFLDRVQDASLAIQQTSSQSGAMNHLPRLVIEPLMVVFVVALTWVTIAVGSQAESVFVTLGIFGLAALRLMPAVTQVSNSLVSLRGSQFAVEQMYADLKLADTIDRATLVPAQESDQALAKAEDFSSVEFNNVTFRYEGAATTALKNVDMKLDRGQSIGIIGRSGAGKTTLVDLLLGLLTPSEGEICVDGVSIQQDISSWRQKTAYIPQEIFIMDESIRQNIALGIPEQEIDDEKIKQVISEVQLEELIDELPDGTATVVGEHGTRLSGGQRQRVAIARALYHDREVIVMDEATAALDNETEEEIIKAIDTVKGKKTFVIIAHRLTTLRHCDVVYRFEAGVLSEKGSYFDIVEGKFGLRGVEKLEELRKT